MPVLVSSLHNLTFIKPNPVVHALTTLSWFESADGNETLLLMGNADHEIHEPSLTEQLQILEDFTVLEEKNAQLTWMIVFNSECIGVAWIELRENHGVMPPSIHLMIGSKKHRGMGIGTATMQALIEYIKVNFQSEVFYSRHLKSNQAVIRMNQKLGFENDGLPYTDDNKLEWQNVILVFAP